MAKKYIQMATVEMVYATAVLLALLSAIIIFLVIWGSRRTRSMRDYAVGSQRFSPVAVALSLAASITSAATFVINPGFIALYGLSGLLAFAVVMPIGLSLSLIVLTKSFLKYGQRVQALTLSQWMGKRFNSSGFALMFGVLSLLLISFMVLICVGMTKVLAQALNASEPVVLVVLVAFVYGYMMFGGANAMVYTNTIQALLMIVVAIVMLGSGWVYFKDGLSGFYEQLARTDPQLVKFTNPESYLFRDAFEAFFCNFVVGIAVVCQPHILTRSLLLQRESEVNRYLLVAIVVEFLFFAVVLTGLYARLTFPDLVVGGKYLTVDGIIPAYVVQGFPVAVSLLLILGILAAGLSTLEGLIQSVPTTITFDIIAPLVGSAMGEGTQREKRLFWINRGVIALLGVVTALISYQQLRHPNLSVGIFAQNGVYAYFSAAFVPVLMGIFLPKAPRLAPILAAITAVGVHFGAYYGGWSWYLQGAVRNPAVAVTYAILASVVVGGVVYGLAPKKNLTHG